MLRWINGSESMGNSPRELMKSKLGIIFVLCLLGYLMYSFRVFYLSPKVRFLRAVPNEAKISILAWSKTDERMKPLPFSFELAWECLLNPIDSEVKTVHCWPEDGAYVHVNAPIEPVGCVRSADGWKIIE